MNSVDLIVTINFAVERSERSSRVWRRLDGMKLAQRLQLPQPVLLPDAVIELTLDGEPRELRVEGLRWSVEREELQLQLVPTESLAAAAKTLGLRARRPWLARRAVEAFLQRCREAGWQVPASTAVRKAPKPAPGKPVAAERPVVAERQEPTL